MSLENISGISSKREIDKGFSLGKILTYTASDGKTYQVDYYNLDVIISVGYRVKSQRVLNLDSGQTRC